MQQIKGNVLRSRLAFVEQQAGADGKARVMEAMGAEDREALRGVVTVKWYPFELGKRLDDAIVRVLGGGDPAYFERLGEASAQENLAGFHKAFLTPGRPHVFMGKAQAIYGLYYETGRREYVQTSEREGVLTTHDADTFSRPDCLTVVGWYRRALEMCGAAGVRVVEEECRADGGAVCRYRVSWS